VFHHLCLTAGEEWRRLSTVDKAPYEQRAEEERRKYEQAMKEYNITGGSAAAKKARVEEAQKDAKTAAEAVTQSLSSMHAQQQQLEQEQQQQQLQQQQQQQMQQPQPQQQQANSKGFETDDNADDDDNDDESYDDEDDE